VDSGRGWHSNAWLIVVLPIVSLLAFAEYKQWMSREVYECNEYADRCGCEQHGARSGPEKLCQRHYDCCVSESHSTGDYGLKSV
jgi:hypothetical protein